MDYIILEDALRAVLRNIYVFYTPFPLVTLGLTNKMHETSISRKSRLRILQITTEPLSIGSTESDLRICSFLFLKQLLLLFYGHSAPIMTPPRGAKNIHQLMAYLF